MKVPAWSLLVAAGLGWGIAQWGRPPAAPVGGRVVVEAPARARIVQAGKPLARVALGRGRRVWLPVEASAGPLHVEVLPPEGGAAPSCAWEGPDQPTRPIPASGVQQPVVAGRYAIVCGASQTEVLLAEVLLAEVRR